MFDKSKISFFRQGFLIENIIKMKKGFICSGKKHEKLAVVLPIMLFYLCFTTLQAQVSTWTNSPHSFSMPDVQASDKGFLISRLIFFQRTEKTQANLPNVIFCGSAATAGEHSITGLTTSNWDSNHSRNTFSEREHTRTISAKLKGLIASLVVGSGAYGFTQSRNTTTSKSCADTHILTTNNNRVHAKCLRVNLSIDNQSITVPVVLPHLSILLQGVKCQFVHLFRLIK